LAVRKKKLQKWLLIEKWWQPSNCQDCQKNNGNNGELECETKGTCWCLAHDAAKANGIQGDPRQFLDMDLAEFVSTVRNAICLSPLDASGRPTLQALGWFDLETPYDAPQAMRLALMILSDLATNHKK
jgi:hypothetical protein